MEYPHHLSDLGSLRHRPRVAPAALMIGGLCLAVSGCVTSAKYRLAKAGSRPAQPLGLAVTEAPLELDLGTVIVFKGPGSWKREARWDEYVVVLVNYGRETLVVESAALIDVRSQARAPGEDPWKLEKQSRSNWAVYRKTGLTLAAGAGTAVYVGAVASVAEVGPMAGGAATAGAVAVLDAIPVVALLEISMVEVMNHRNKLAVQKEFQRRRLALPRDIAPGESVSGSLFFPMTPGPQRLIVRGRAAAEPVEAVLDLAALATLHLAQAPQSRSTVPADLPRRRPTT